MPRRKPRPKRVRIRKPTNAPHVRPVTAEFAEVLHELAKLLRRKARCARDVQVLMGCSGPASYTRLRGLDRLERLAGRVGLVKTPLDGEAGKTGPKTIYYHLPR